MVPEPGKAAPTVPVELVCTPKAQPVSAKEKQSSANQKALNAKEQANQAQAVKDSISNDDLTDASVGIDEV